MAKFGQSVSVFPVLSDDCAPFVSFQIDFYHANSFLMVWRKSENEMMRKQRLFSQNSSPKLVPARHRCTAQGAQTVRNHHTRLVGSAKSAPPPPPLQNHHHLCIIVTVEEWDWINARTLHVSRPLLFLWRRIIQMSRRQHRHSNWKQRQRFSTTANDKLEGGWSHERVKRSSLFSSDNSAARRSAITASFSFSLIWHKQPGLSKTNLLRGK